MTLVLVLLFLLSGVLGRIFLQYKATGDYGIRPAGKHSPPVQIAASLLLVLSAVIILFYTAGQALGYLLPWYQPGFLQITLGYILYAIGLLVVLVAQQQMGSAWRIGVDASEKTRLITEGAFQFVRNPIYTGLFVGGIGLLVITPSLTLLIGLLVGYVAVELFVRRVEEPYLREQFGPEYDEWFNATSRYFPKLF